MNSRHLSHDEAKRRGGRIAARLTALGHDIPLNHGLQALAAAEDYPDWNRMKAALRRPKAHVADPGTIAEEALETFDDYDPARDIDPDAPVVYRITHRYDIGNQDIFLTRKTGDIEARRAAVYVWCKAEEAFAHSLVSNLGIAAMLCAFYGFEQHWATYNATTIDLYAETQGIEDYAGLMADPALARDGLVPAVRPFVSPA